MSVNTNIEWTDHTFNPWIGCTKISAGCKNCYAERQNARWGNDNWGPGATRRVTSPAYWTEPVKWAKSAAARNVREMVFTASLADIFDAEAPVDARRNLWALIRQTCYSLDWQIVTKRPERIRQVMEEDGLDADFFLDCRVWLLTSTENQEEANNRFPYLLQIPSTVRGVSAEPLLGPVNLSIAAKGFTCSGTDDGREHPLRGLDWVIVGGESQSGARPPQLEWVRSLRDQCQSAGVSFFFKQWGEWLPAGCDGSPDVGQTQILNASDRPIRIGKKAAGALLDGQLWREFPRVSAAR